MASGMFLKIIGGWLDFTCTYEGTFPGLEYGQCLPLFRSSVTSKKLTTVTLASIVIFKKIETKGFTQIFFYSSNPLWCVLEC
jgi:hypothetical protein